MVQLKATVVRPPLVERLRVASPPKAHICMNSLTDAPKNWELVLVDMLTGLENWT